MQDIEEAKKLRRSKNADCDHVLQYLVHLANLGFEIGITLSTNAGIITGTLIGGAAYFDQLEQSFTEHLNEEVKAPVKMVFELWRQPYKEQPEGDVDDHDDLPLFIHLKDAKTVSAGRYVPAQGALWRGKITEVIGFSFGALADS